jgi:hypothetical protein
MPAPDKIGSRIPRLRAVLCSVSCFTAADLSRRSVRPRYLIFCGLNVRGWVMSCGFLLPDRSWGLLGL